jgi:uncharacterized protein
LCAGRHSHFRGAYKGLNTELHDQRKCKSLSFSAPLCLCGEIDSAMIPIHDTPAGALFTIRLHPRAKKNAITGEIGDALKLSLTSPPVDGRANDACIEFFAKLLKVPRSSVTIASGQTSRRKTIRVAGISADEVRKRIET